MSRHGSAYTERYDRRYEEKYGRRHKLRPGERSRPGSHSSFQSVASSGGGRSASRGWWLTARLVGLALLYENWSGRRGGRKNETGMVWVVYWPLLLVAAAAIAAGVAIVVRKLRGKGDNPFIVKR